MLTPEAAIQIVTPNRGTPNRYTRSSLSGMSNKRMVHSVNSTQPMNIAANREGLVEDIVIEGPLPRHIMHDTRHVLLHLSDEAKRVGANDNHSLPFVGADVNPFTRIPRCDHDRIVGWSHIGDICHFENSAEREVTKAHAVRKYFPILKPEIEWSSHRKYGNGHQSIASRVAESGTKQ